MKKKKIVIITGSPRKGGNTDKMATAFENQANQSEMEVVRFDTAFLKIQGCHVCNNCFKHGKACLFDDDFNKIADEIKIADGIVFVSPIYWYSFSAQIKPVIDRLYAFNETKDKLNNKKVALISCCADKDSSVFNGMKFEFERSMKLLKAEIVDEILISNAGNIGDIEKTDGIERAKELVRMFE